MPTFAYRASTATGRTLRGREEAASAAELERALSQRGLLPISISVATEGASGRRGPRRGRRADVVGAVRYLATLMEAGFPLDRALGAVQRVAARADVAEVLQAVRAEVRTGRGLADALAAHPRVFPRLAVGMVRAGERGGQLAKALSRLAVQMEREQELRSRVVSSLMYPAVLASVGSLALVVLLVYVLPRFTVVLEEAGAELPRSTAFLISGAGLLADWWPLLLVVPALLALIGVAYYRSAEGRLVIDRLLLRLPAIGGMRRHIAAVRLGNTLATLLRSGMPVLPAMDIAAVALADEGAAELVRQAREEVRIGGRLAPALERAAIFPDLFVQMVEVGEEGGRLPEMLERASAALEEELERHLDRSVRLVEPAMILLFGGAVGFVALALLQAIYGIQPDTIQAP